MRNNCAKPIKIYLIVAKCCILSRGIRIKHILEMPDPDSYILVFFMKRQDESASCKFQFRFEYGPVKN
jgi:hypothetical protein